MSRFVTVVALALSLTGCATMNCPGVDRAMDGPMKTWGEVACWGPPGFNLAATVVAIPVFLGTAAACRAEHARTPAPIEPLAAPIEPSAEPTEPPAGPTAGDKLP
jgi:hypothetical protein